MFNRNILTIFLCVALGATISCDPKTKVDPKADAPKTTGAKDAKKDVKKDDKTAGVKTDTAKVEPKKPAESAAAILPYTATGPVAKVGGIEIAAAEFNAEVKKIAPMAAMIPAPKIALMKSQIIDNLVSKKIVEMAVAPTLKDIKAEDLAMEFKRFTDQMSKNPGGVEQFYKRAGLTEADIKEDMKKGLALKAMLAKDYDIKVSPKDIKAFYTTNKARFEQKGEVKASHILFKAKDGDKAGLAAAKKKAMDVYKLAKKPGADFAALAKEKSEGPSAPKGGDLGFFTKERMVPEFSKAAFAAKKGGITKPVKTSFGYHVIKVVDKKVGGLTPLKEVSDMISQQLEMGKMKEVMGTYLTKQKEAQKVEIMLTNVVDNPKFKSKPMGMPGMGGGMPPGGMKMPKMPKGGLKMPKLNGKKLTPPKP